MLRIVALLALIVSTATAAGSVWTNGGPEEAEIEAIAVSPRQSSLVIAAGETAIFRSTDAGESWVRAHRGGILLKARRVLFDPRGDDVYVPVRDGMLHSPDGGKSWRPLPALAETYVTELIVDVPRDTIYFSTINGLFVGTGKRPSWTKRPSPPGDEGLGITALAVDPANGRLWAGSAGGLFESRDAGKSWRRIHSVDGHVTATVFDPPSTLHIVTNKRYSRSEDRGATWKKPAAVAATDVYDIIGGAKTLYAKADFSIMASRDGGQTWNDLSAPDAAPLRLPAADPKSSSTLYASAFDDAIYKSLDGGKSWSRKVKGLTGAVVHSLVADPRKPGALYALGKHVYASSDHGRTWKTILRTEAPPFTAIARLFIEPDSTLVTYDIYPAIPRRSRDGGKTWKEGAAEDDFPFLSRDPKSGAIWRVTLGGVAVSADGGKSWKVVAEQRLTGPIAVGAKGVLFAPSGFQLLMSSDRGASWKSVLDEYVYDVAIDPKNPLHLYAATGSGVMRNTNGGAGEWRHWSPGITAPVRAIAVHPREPIVFAATEGAGVYRSPASGDWIPLGSDGPAYASVLVLDPHDPGRLYVGTEGESVYVLTWDQVQK